MLYNFDRTQDHRYNGSIRWEQSRENADVIGMGTADMDYECAPCIQESFRCLCEENTYNYRVKPRDYYQSVIRWFNDIYKLETKKDWMSNVPGTIAAIRIAVEKFSEKGSCILMQTPYFEPLRRVIEGAERIFLENPMVLAGDKYMIDFFDFEEKIAHYKPSIFLLVNPQNPTGRVFTLEELSKLVDICEKYGVKIISDEVHFLLTYGNERHIPILAVSEKARKISIQIFSFSKGFNIMGLPHAIVLIANEDRQKVWNDYLTPFSFGYATNAFAVSAVTAVTGGRADEWLIQVTQYMKKNLELFIYEVDRRKLPIRPLKPEAGYFLWIDCRNSKIKPEDLGKFFLEKAGIQLNNGLEHGEEGRGFVRLNFAVTRAHLLEAIDRMESMFMSM